MYQITEWATRYEVSYRGSEAKDGDKLQRGPLKFIRLKVHGRQMGLGYRKLKRVANNRLMETFGIFCKFLEIAGDQPSELRGGLLNDKDLPATAADLAFILDIPLKQITNAIDALIKIGWVTNTEIELNITKPNIRVRKIPETPEISGKETDFSIFWKAYPNKKSKGAAEKAWKALAPAAWLQALMLKSYATPASTSRINTSISPPSINPVGNQSESAVFLYCALICPPSVTSSLS